MVYIKKSPKIGQKHLTNAVAYLQSTQREALVYLPFYWVAHSPRWLLISPQKLLSPVFANTNDKPPAPRSSFYRPLNPHRQTVSVFICCGLRMSVCFKIPSHVSNALITFSLWRIHWGPSGAFEAVREKIRSQSGKWRKEKRWAKEKRWDREKKWNM